MAKQPKYKRTLGKDGKPYYFELKKDNRGVERYVPIDEKKGRKKFIEKNYDNLTKPSKRKNLSDKEQESFERSKIQKELWRIKGKPVKRWKTDLLEFTNMIDPKAKTRDLEKLPTPYNRPSEVDKDVNQILKSLPLISVETEIGASGFRERTEATGIHDIVERLDFVGTDGWKIAVTTEDGDVIRGESALTYMKDWEIRQTEIISEEESNVSMVRFRYQVQYDGATKTIFIDINDVDSEIAQSDPIKRTGR
jgi:hypothetical protein